MLAAVPAVADVVGDPVIEGNSLRADVAAGGVSATLTIRFQNVVGLNLANLGLSVTAVDPSAAGLVTRLGTVASVPAAFPLMVTIEPPASGGLSFSGLVSIELYTHDLQYTAGTPLRLYSAPLGGAFTDVTNSLGSGSYRSGGTKGDFSEFLIVTDLRPLTAVIDGKYSRLSQLLQRHAGQMSPAIYNELQGLLNASASAYQQGAMIATAIDYIESFDDRVKAYSGNGIPDVWRSARDLTNVAGELRASAGTLRFSLTVASNTQ